MGDIFASKDESFLDKNRLAKKTNELKDDEGAKAAAPKQYDHAVYYSDVSVAILSGCMGGLSTFAE